MEAVFQKEVLKLKENSENDHDLKQNKKKENTPKEKLKLKGRTKREPQAINYNSLFASTHRANNIADTICNTKEETHFMYERNEIKKNVEPISCFDEFLTRANYMGGFGNNQNSFKEQEIMY
jgi:hypothetical protein